MKRAAVNKKQREEEQQAIGQIYKQYIDTFQETDAIPAKTFVRSGTLFPDENDTSKSSDKIQEKHELYNPKPIIKIKRKDTKSQKVPNPIVPRKGTKRKSNLKSLGDELKLLQHERQSKEIKVSIPKHQSLLLSPFVQENEYSNSTNLFVSNLNPQVTENHLIELFGSYGPLASVKIMWPRNEPVSRSANCGFVAFMSRVDAERAMNELKNHEEMRINWGKAVKLPNHPIHIPPELYKLYAPPPPSGLPFNAQNNTDLSKATIKVTIPFDRNLLMVIHRVIEFVVREGPEFEALIMNLELGNPEYLFLFEFRSPAHIYYRWKLYSILKGDPKNSWPMKPFRMFKDGSIWLPPIMPNYKDGMPIDLIAKNSKQSTRITDSEALELIQMIKTLTISRKSIATAMVFCLNLSNTGKDVIEIVIDSLKNVGTNILKKVARLYLLSDILYNCKVKGISIEDLDHISLEFLDIFQQFHKIYQTLKHTRDQECLKTKIFMILRSWLFHKLYEVKFIGKLENIFLHGNETGDEEDDFNDEPLDGAILLKRSLAANSSDCKIVSNSLKSKKVFDMFK